jgi:predicted amidophosphoribosyltransferase
MICADCGDEIRPEWCDVCESEAPGDVCWCCKSTVPALRLLADSTLEARHPLCLQIPGYKAEIEEWRARRLGGGA